jgi:hypothetical protein
MSAPSRLAVRGLIEQRDVDGQEIWFSIARARIRPTSKGTGEQASPATATTQSLVGTASWQGW